MLLANGDTRSCRHKRGRPNIRMAEETLNSLCRIGRYITVSGAIGLMTCANRGIRMLFQDTASSSLESRSGGPRGRYSTYAIGTASPLACSTADTYRLYSAKDNQDGRDRRAESFFLHIF